MTEFTFLDLKKGAKAPSFLVKFGFTYCDDTVRLPQTMPL